MSPRRLDLLLLATVSVLTFEKIRWETPAVTLTLTNLLSVAFVIAFLVDRIRRRDFNLPAASVTLIGFMGTFLAVYLAGYYDLQNHAALTFWLKGVGSWAAHFAFLICGVAYMVRRGRPLFMRAVRWFVGGLVVNCVYGLLQIVFQVGAGINLDRIVIGRITAGQGGVGGLGVFGKVSGTQTIYRVNALTGDPNHLGVMLCIPLMLLLPYYLEDRRGRRLIGLLLLMMLGVQALTLSRSAALGDIAGLLVLTPIIRPLMPSRRTLATALGTVAGLFVLAFLTSHFFRTVVQARTNLSGSSTSAHLRFYSLVPPALDPHPLFGMGFNTFAVFYQFLTGRTDFGAHSIWVATLVETGIVGLSVYVVYVAYLILSASRIRLSPDAEESRLGYGLTASIVATAVANTFYLTMSFDYFFALALLAVSGAALFAPVRQSPPVTAAAAGLGVRRA
ncbi:MAG: O-antigen ligase family protein [Gaiellales bacterium]